MLGAEWEAALVELLDRVSATVAASDDPEFAARAALEAVCETIGWPVGHLYVPEDAGGRFVSSGIWAGEAEEFPALREATALTAIPFGADLVGRAAEAGRPLWSRDAGRDPAFARARRGADLGVGAVLALPVVTADGVAGVLEFFSREEGEPDASLVRAMAALGRQLGQLVDRWRAQREMERTRRRMERLIETSVEAFVAIDAEGRVIGWNAGAERMFGLPREQAVGRLMNQMIVPPRYREADQAGRDRFLATGRSRVLGRRLELTALRADGSEFPVELVVWANRNGGAWTFNAFVHDVTDRHQAERALRRPTSRNRSPSPGWRS
nr:hypothetical protein GCM10020093_058130 [Planobispora longispora]